MEIAEAETSQHTRGTPVLRPTAPTMQKHGYLSMGNGSGAARAPHLQAHTMSLRILNDLGRQGRPPQRRQNAESNSDESGAARAPQTPFPTHFARNLLKIC